MSKLIPALQSIEYTIAYFVIIGGVYLMSAPWFEGFIPKTHQHNALREALVNKPGLMTFGFLYLIPGLSLLYGLLADKRAFRKHGLFGVYTFIFFIEVLNIATAGILPISWLAPITVAVISAIIWFQIKREEKLNERRP